MRHHFSAIPALPPFLSMSDHLFASSDFATFRAMVGLMFYEDVKDVASVWFFGDGIVAGGGSEERAT